MKLILLTYKFCQRVIPVDKITQIICYRNYDTKEHEIKRFIIYTDEDQFEVKYDAANQYTRLLCYLRNDEKDWCYILGDDSHKLVDKNI